MDVLLLFSRIWHINLFKNRLFIHLVNKMKIEYFFFYLHFYSILEIYWCSEYFEEGSFLISNILRFNTFSPSVHLSLPPAPTVISHKHFPLNYDINPSSLLVKCKIISPVASPHFSWLCKIKRSIHSAIGMTKKIFFWNSNCNGKSKSKKSIFNKSFFHKKKQSQKFPKIEQKKLPQCHCFVQ